MHYNSSSRRGQAQLFQDSVCEEDRSGSTGVDQGEHKAAAPEIPKQGEPGADLFDLGIPSTPKVPVDTDVAFFSYCRLPLKSGAFAHKSETVGMLIEDQRFLHEDLERLEQAISDRVAEEPRNVSANDPTV